MAHLLKTFRLPAETIAEIESLAAQYGSQSKVIQAAVALLRPVKSKGRVEPTPKQQAKDYDPDQDWGA